MKRGGQAVRVKKVEFRGRRWVFVYQLVYGMREAILLAHIWLSA